MKHVLYLFLVMWLGALSGGCSGDGKAVVQGQVTLDGNPIEVGTIRFVPINGVGVTTGSAIENGKYSAQVVPSKLRIEIQGFKKIGEKRYEPKNPLSPILPQFASVVPDRYHRNSELSAEVQEDQILDFVLSSEKNN